jgi:hypothetical protein
MCLSTHNLCMRRKLILLWFAKTLVLGRTGVTLWWFLLHNGLSAKHIDRRNMRRQQNTGCKCGRVAVVSPELLSLTVGYLGIASVCLALAVWRFYRFYNQSLGRLCRAKHASAWGSSHRVPCCRACLRMGEWLPQDCCELSRWKRLRAPPWDIPLLRAGWF